MTTGNRNGLQDSPFHWQNKIRNGENMSTGKLMRELFIELESLSDAEIILEYGIEYLNFKIDATKKLKQLRLARIYIPVTVNNSYIGIN